MEQIRLIASSSSIQYTEQMCDERMAHEASNRCTAGGPTEAFLCGKWC
jgi:hypothetical protein